MVRHATGAGAHSAAPRLLAVIGNAILWMVIGVNAWFLWPESLGGSTAFIIVNGTSMEPTYYQGDLVVARKGEPQVGDVVVYEPEGYGGARVVHRIIGGDATTGWVTQGDNNDWIDQWQPTNEAIVGIVEMHFGGIGKVTAFFLTPWPWAFVLLSAVALLLWPEDEDEGDGKSLARRHGDSVFDGVPS